MAKNGFIQPFIPAKIFGAVDQFEVTDLKGFLKRLFAGAHSVKKPKPNQFDIPDVPTEDDQ